MVGAFCNQNCRTTNVFSDLFDPKEKKVFVKIEKTIQLISTFKSRKNLNFHSNPIDFANTCHLRSSSTILTNTAFVGCRF